MYKIIIQVLLDYVGFNHCSNGRSVWKTWVSHWIPSYSCHSNNICALLFFFKVGLSEIVESEQYEHELYPLDTSGTSLCPGWSDHVVGVGVEVEVRLLHNIVRSSCWGEFVQLSSYALCCSLQLDVLFYLKSNALTHRTWRRKHMYVHP